MADSSAAIYARIMATVDQTEPLQAILDEEGPEALIDAVLTARNGVEESELKAAVREMFAAADECERAARNMHRPGTHPDYPASAARSREAKEALRVMVDSNEKEAASG